MWAPLFCLDPETLFAKIKSFSLYHTKKNQQYHKVWFSIPANGHWGEKGGDCWNTFSSAVSHMKGSADVLGEYTRVLTTTNQFFWSKEAAALH
jgi:hypothetical protein